MAPTNLITLRQLRARGPAQERLHQESSRRALGQFGRRIFIRGVVEVSNYCRENCLYCGMRRDNRTLERLRADHDQLAEMLLYHCPASITDINLQGGEDPVAVRELVLPLIRTLRAQTNLGVSVCLGTLSPPLYQELKEAGASIYLMKFEVAQSKVYDRVQAPGNLQERLDHIRHLARHGWHVSSGFIAGLPGQTDQDILACLDLAAQLPVAGCSVSPFIPGEATPWAQAAPADLDLTLNCMAGLRLLRPDWLIPAVSALNLSGKATSPLEGYRRGLRLGANLATINLTPAGLRNEYLLYRRDRFIMTEDRVLAAIQAEGLLPSRQSMAAYYQNQRNQAGPAPLCPEPLSASAISLP